MSEKKHRAGPTLGKAFEAEGAKWLVCFNVRQNWRYTAVPRQAEQLLQMTVPADRWAASSWWLDQLADPSTAAGAAVPQWASSDGRSMMRRNEVSVDLATFPGSGIVGEQWEFGRGKK